MTHHWRKKDKKNPEFIAKYPYAASHAALVEHFVNKHNHDHGLKHRVLVFDSAFTTCDLFRMLMRKGNDAVGSLKFPFAGVPQSLLWSKKRVNKRGGPAVFPGDCYHIRSVTDDRTLGVQQVMVRGGPPAASFKFSVCMHAWCWPHKVQCRMVWLPVVIFRTILWSLFSRPSTLCTRASVRTWRPSTVPGGWWPRASAPRLTVAACASRSCSPLHRGSTTTTTMVSAACCDFHVLHQRLAHVLSA